jgi:hypothetical protein
MIADHELCHQTITHVTSLKDLSLSSWILDLYRPVQCDCLTYLDAGDIDRVHWDCSGRTVRVFERNLHSRSAIEFHAFAPLESSMRVTNDIPLGSLLLLPVGTVNSVQTRKDVFVFVDTFKQTNMEGVLIAFLGQVLLAGGY